VRLREAVALASRFGGTLSRFGRRLFATLMQGRAVVSPVMV
jgi:hypothetical protein